ncbi:MAG TPA: hypothetical protein DCY74_03705 [Clostridiales bacterium]|nr:hypothetical protein [Clostridiales bacterium]
MCFILSGEFNSSICTCFSMATKEKERKKHPLMDKFMETNKKPRHMRGFLIYISIIMGKIIGLRLVFP